ncbi:hypothetical protein [Chitinophaga japonensis]|uniref:Uncharacterized protein n=1 Tax=Chitinophaga japonensis TaxID=104662 RepID=A0A562TF09_CHIJA|nr:hypothetical protein [Chitinophaga japonensis]TWI91854.1 hypothetical protein LX66_1235 [Chitinophaga japonensis]
MRKILLPFLTVAVLWGVCCACESDYNAPSFSCSGYTFDLSLQDSTSSTLALSNNTYFRTPTDTGGYKYITLEAVVDSFKIIFNLKDGPYYDDATLWNDNFPVKTYRYRRYTDSAASGLVVAGIRAGDSFQYLDTDTSSITLTEWNAAAQTMTGHYYFEADNRSYKGQGTFSNVCFISLK